MNVFCYILTKKIETVVQQLVSWAVTPLGLQVNKIDKIWKKDPVYGPKIACFFLDNFFEKSKMLYVHKKGEASKKSRKFQLIFAAMNESPNFFEGNELLENVFTNYYVWIY